MKDEFRNRLCFIQDRTGFIPKKLVKKLQGQLIDQKNRSLSIHFPTSKILCTKGENKGASVKFKC